MQRERTSVLRFSAAYVRVILPPSGSVSTSSASMTYVLLSFLKKSWQPKIVLGIGLHVPTPNCMWSAVHPRQSGR